MGTKPTADGYCKDEGAWSHTGMCFVHKPTMTFHPALGSMLLFQHHKHILVYSIRKHLPK